METITILVEVYNQVKQNLLPFLINDGLLKKKVENTNYGTFYYSL